MKENIKHEIQRLMFALEVNERRELLESTTINFIKIIKKYCKIIREDHQEPVIAEEILRNSVQLCACVFEGDFLCGIKKIKVLRMLLKFVRDNGYLDGKLYTSLTDIIDEISSHLLDHINNGIYK